MHLKRLEIVGFKSFADVFRMDFLPGVSCVVGPNGCGKSNVADAIRWVLGSQSPIQLRVDRMEDVIFSGSEKRNPLGMAEVILVLDNEDRSLPFEFDEVSITRRLFRSGESEYLINSTKCRLMDITNLIVDKGLGHNGYWILESRMIKTIIESKPQDRRFLFDEAAGIVKYKIQRHRAELKLDAVSHDLERLDDIISEVERSVKALRSQVRVFNRYEKAELRITHLSGLRTHRLLVEFSELLDKLSIREKVAKADEQKEIARVSAAEAKHANSEVKLDKVQQELDIAHTTCSQLDTELSGIRRDMAVTTVHLQNSESASGEYSRRSEEEKIKAEKCKDTLLLEIEGKRVLNEKLTEADAEYTGIVNRVAALDSDYKKACDNVDEIRRNYSDISEKYTSMETEFTDSLREFERVKQELQNAEKKTEDLKDRIVDTKNELDTAATEKAACAARKNERTSRLAATEKVLEEIDSKLEAEDLRMRDCELERNLLEVRAKDLEDAQELSSETTGLSTEVFPRDGMGKAVSAWLDGFQSASVQSVKAIMEVEGGKRFLLPREKYQRPELPPTAVPLTDCLESDHPDELFSGVVVAPDRETALEWFLNGLELDIVTHEGDLFRSTGLVRLGIPPTGTGTLDRKVMIDEVEKRKEVIETKFNSIKAGLDKLNSESSIQSETAEKLRSEVRALELEEASMQLMFNQAEKRLKEYENELERLSESIPLLNAVAGSNSPDAPDSMNSLRVRMEELSEQTEKAELKRTVIGEDRSKTLRLESEAAIAVSTLQSEIKQSEETIKRLRRDVETAGELSDEFSAKSNESKGNSAKIRIEQEKQKKLVDAISLKREKAEEVRIQASGERGSWLQKTREYNIEVSTARSSLSSIREDLAGISGESAALKQKLSEFKEEEIVLPDESSKYWDYDEQKLLSELERQRGYRKDIGPVNMLAVAEYDEARKRLVFLNEQRTDLEDARNSLLDAIGEINTSAEKIFTEVFVQIKENFQAVFTKLFGGGRADVIALRSEDPLEGGIQIIAQPPGKKMENVTSLSDGEKAMTAVALLFALYLVKPSPFCVLDELDAPLDDSNVDNFMTLIRGFIAKTQFIIITHNKRTMETADRLFGITMAEKGVSFLTSVSLELAAEIAGSYTDEP